MKSFLTFAVVSLAWLNSLSVVVQGQTPPKIAQAATYYLDCGLYRPVLYDASSNVPMRCRLKLKPNSTVTVTFSPEKNVVSLSRCALTFEPDNFNVFQEVLISPGVSIPTSPRGLNYDSLLKFTYTTVDPKYSRVKQERVLVRRILESPAQFCYTLGRGVPSRAFSGAVISNINEPGFYTLFDNLNVAIEGRFVNCSSSASVKRVCQTAITMYIGNLYLGFEFSGEEYYGYTSGNFLKYFFASGLLRPYSWWPLTMLDGTIVYLYLRIKTPVGRPYMHVWIRTPGKYVTPSTGLCSFKITPNRDAVCKQNNSTVGCLPIPDAQSRYNFVGPKKTFRDPIPACVAQVNQNSEPVAPVPEQVTAQLAADAAKRGIVPDAAALSPATSKDAPVISNPEIAAAMVKNIPTTDSDNPPIVDMPWFGENVSNDWGFPIKVREPQA